MRPEPFPAEDSDDSRTVVQDAELFYGAELDGDSRRSSFVKARRGVAETARDSALPGMTVAEKYRVEQVVEKTAHEVVSIARHVELGEPVVLRYLTQEGAASPELVASFLRGARDALKLNGFHAERVTDLGRLRTGAPYRVAPLPRGPSLEEFVQVRGALPSEDAVDLVLLACEGVAEAHALGLLHRNLSTSNIVLERHPDGAPLVKVRNFGVLDPLEHDPELEGRFGRHFSGRSSNALRYASPEQIRQPDAVDQRADLWALGAIAYELIAGVPAYAARSPSALLAMIVADPPIALESHAEGIPPELEAVVLSCLSKHPDGRPSSIEELVHQLLPFASEQVDGIATRVQRVLAHGAARSYGPYSSRSPRRRTTVPALPARASGPFHGSGTLPPLPKLPSFERGDARDRFSPSQRFSQRRPTRAADEGDTGRPNAAKSALLMLAGASIGVVIALLFVASRPAANPAAVREPGVPTPSPTQTPVTSGSVVAAPSLAQAPTLAPARPKPAAPARRDTEPAASANRERDPVAPLADAKPSADDGAIDTVDDALFDKPE